MDGLKLGEILVLIEEDMLGDNDGLILSDIEGLKLGLID